MMGSSYFIQAVAAKESVVEIAPAHLYIFVKTMQALDQWLQRRAPGPQDVLALT
jgi:hypothetical protein